MTKPFKLKSDFKPAGHQPGAINQLVEGLEDGFAKQALLGVTGSGKTFVMANVIERTQRPAIILAPNKTLAAQLYSEMRDFFPDNAIEYFVSYYDYYQPEAYVPSSDTFIEKDAAINDHIEQMRLSATKAIIERKDTITVASVSAIYGLGDPESYLGMILHVSQGDRIDQRQILRRLAEIQYKRNDTEFARGNYRVRGDVIDIFPIETDSAAIRIELFDEDVERLTYFDPLTGKTISETKRITIFPRTHYVTPRDRLLKMVDYIKAELKERLAFLRDNDKLVAAERLEQRTTFDIEMILELGYCSGIENYSRYLSKREPGQAPPTLMDYLPDNALLFIDESHVTVPQIGAMYHGDRSRKQNLVDYGFRLPSAMDNRPLNFEEFEKLAGQTIYVSATPGDYELETQDKTVELLVRPTGLIDPEVIIRPVRTQVDDLLSEIQHEIKANQRVLVTTLTKKMSEDLTDYIAETGVKVRYLHSGVDTVERVEIIKDLRLGNFDVLIGINLLREGLDIPEVGLVAILDADKEGFLRAYRPLVQTSGRAARNLNGRVIMYADRETAAMNRAITEMKRRRKIQLAFNKEHGITPASIIKKVKDTLDTSYKEAKENQAQQAVIAEMAAKYQVMKPAKFSKEIKRLEKEMYDAAADMEFEKAAAIRDKIHQIKQITFTNTDSK